ncbi:glycosyltransferase family 4 protein [Solicola sp. PLA-1-18]|uniref:glycosyltransferase family 4 protein n=1 Tax=Solicola sp. PLA-1-18 TaxID=3380532 RepID=UPI003B7662BF
MRILHVSDVYLPRLGGIELHVRDLAGQQAARGHDVVVVTATPGAPLDPLVRVVVVDRWGRDDVLDALVGWADVVHTHSSVVSPLAWVATRRATAAGVPVVLTMHSLVQRSAVVRAGWRRVGAGLGAGVRWTSVSSVGAAGLAELVPADVGVLPNGIVVEPWTRPRTVSATERSVVAVMRLSARKRALPLVDVLSDVRATVDASIPLRATIVGDGPQRCDVQRMLDDRGMDWVELTGRLDRTQIAHELARADVFLAPATLESFGIAALEARCTGLPVVAMARGGVGDFVTDGVEGYLVRDDADMAARTAALLTDADLRGTMTAASLAHRPRYDWDTVVAMTTEQYRVAEVLSASCQRRTPSVTA